MDTRAADEILADTDVEVVLEAPIAEAKAIAAACLAADIPVALGKDDHCTKGCAPKLMLLARAEDTPKVGALLRARWAEAAAREGGAPPRLADVGPDAMPCLACGAAVPDSAAECPDCGIAC